MTLLVVVVAIPDSTTRLQVPADTPVPMVRRWTSRLLPSPPPAAV